MSLQYLSFVNCAGEEVALNRTVSGNFDFQVKKLLSSRQGAISRITELRECSGGEVTEEGSTLEVVIQLEDREELDKAGESEDAHRYKTA